MYDFLRMGFIGGVHIVYHVQVFLLNRRFQQHQQIIWQGRGGVQDRTIYEDSVFAKVNIPSSTILSLSYSPTQYYSVRPPLSLSHVHRLFT